MFKNVSGLKAVVIVIALVACGTLYYSFIRPQQEASRKEAERKATYKTVREEIAGWSKTHHNEHPSAALIKMIDTDPDFVATVIGWHQTKNWTTITEHVSPEILDRAETDSAAALMELKKFLMEDFTAYLVRRKYENPEQERVSWCNNNTCTSFLLIKLPVAQRAGKKKELLQNMCGAPCSEKDWFWDWIGNYVPDNEKQYGKHHWHGSGIWPWKDEEPPAYWHAK